MKVNRNSYLWNISLGKSVMAFDSKNYSPYWKQFSLWVRFERAESKCEKCGIGNGEISQNGGKVCLTVAHLDYEGGVCQCKAIYGFKCAKPSHVLALCNGCHLRMDLPMHIAKRTETLTKRKDANRGLLELMEV